MAHDSMYDIIGYKILDYLIGKKFLHSTGGCLAIQFIIKNIISTKKLIFTSGVDDFLINISTTKTLFFFFK